MTRRYRSRSRFENQTNPERHFAPRCALAGDLLLSIATKEGKSAPYKRVVSRGEFAWIRRGDNTRWSALGEERLLVATSGITHGGIGRMVDSGKNSRPEDFPPGQLVFDR